MELSDTPASAGRVGLPPPLRPTIIALGAIAAYWTIDYGAEALYFGPGGTLSSWGVQSALAQTAIRLACLLLGVLLIRRLDLFPRVVTWVFALGCVVSPASWFWVDWHGDYDSEREWMIFGFALLTPYLLLLLWVPRGLVRRWFLAGLVLAGCYLAGYLIMDKGFYFENLYYVDGGSDEDYRPFDVEGLYGAQEGLMQAQIAALAPGEQGTPEVFALLLGGTAYQSVFMNEVEAVGPILDGHFGSASRTLRLVNSVETPKRYPLANRANLERGLTEIAKRAGPEDVTFLFLTSHGAEDVFSLSFYEAGTTDLTAEDFAAILDRSGIGPAVIVLSACHAGSFLDDIAAPDRLVIAAARADRTSFGCADGRDWTEFGQSFFDLALRADPDPRKAFVVAEGDVRRKEFWSFRRASLPQISEGAEFGAAMDAVLARRKQ